MLLIRDNLLLGHPLAGVASVPPSIVPRPSTRLRRALRARLAELKQQVDQIKETRRGGDPKFRDFLNADRQTPDADSGR